MWPILDMGKDQKINEMKIGTSTTIPNVGSDVQMCVRIEPSFVSLVGTRENRLTLDLAVKPQPQ